VLASHSIQTVATVSRLLIILCLPALWSCASNSEKPEEKAQIPAAQYVAERGMSDDRGRFREVFCAVLEERGSTLPDFRTCDEALTSDGNEKGATGAPVALGNSTSNFLVLLVPGLGWECFSAWLDYEGAAPNHVAQFGYDVRLVPVDGLSGTEKNAAQIRDYIGALPAEDAERPIILLGYSKGTPDILTALVSYPQLQERVVAAVSVAGAVAGSPLADDASQGTANILVHVPGSECGKGDSGAVDSMKTGVRRQWLEENPLPDTIEFFSIVTYPSEERISRGLKGSYRALAKVDARNDTQVLFYDQMIPESTLMAYVNADHWAVAVPVARNHPFVADMFVNRNDYPREALLEAILRYLEERLTE
jgi:hypothetical protein